jgi:RND family efflux transporter MFP subunit
VFWLLPPVLVGIAVVVAMGLGRQPPEKTQAEETARPVRYVEAMRVDLVPEARGYGVVEPERVWAAVAQVAGRVVEMPARLRNGEIMRKGTLLFRIDPVDYELALARARAELAELDASESNTRASLSIQQQDLTIARRELTRIERLAAQGTASRSDVDSARRRVLSARAAVQNSENALALLPARRRVHEASISRARRDLANTRVTAPFNLRITDLAVETDQYVGVGQVLFRGDAVDRVEIVAQFPISSLRNLLLGRGTSAPGIAELATRMKDFTGFRPLLSMDLGGLEAQWQAEFVRFSDQVDPQTRTVGVVVAVDAPLAKAIPGRRPPLSKGMFVQVLMRGHAQPERLVIPRVAIREGRTYVASAEQRLEIREVTSLFSQGPLSVIVDGIETGERVVVSDLVPAVPGMLLAPSADDVLRDALLEAAGAQP